MSLVTVGRDGNGFQLENVRRTFLTQTVLLSYKNHGKNYYGLLSLQNFT